MFRKSNDPARLDAYTDAAWSGDSINRKSTSSEISKIVSGTLREFTKGQSCQTLSSGERAHDDGRGIAPPTTPGILGNAGQAPIQNRFNSSSRHHPATGVRTSQAHETRLLWLPAKHEERKLTVIKEPTQTNTADGFTKALQTAKYLGWRNRLSMGYDNGDDVKTNMREALAESGRWARVEALHAIPRSVLIATLMQQTVVDGTIGIY